MAATENRGTLEARQVLTADELAEQRRLLRPFAIAQIARNKFRVLEREPKRIGRTP
jgi:hypothetical protein